MAPTERNLHDLTHHEIEAIVFAGARSDEPRGLSDALTNAEIISLAEHPAYSEWPVAWKDWVWSAIDNHISEPTKPGLGPLRENGMTNREYLESIIDEAKELLEHASAGGDRELAFDLVISTDDVHGAFSSLYNTNSRIQDEIGEKS